MKRGKKTIRNIAINKTLKAYFAEQGIRSCELRLKGCTPNTPPLDFAHSQRRWKWDSNEELYTSAVLACRSCHNLSSRDKDGGEAVILEAIENRQNHFYDAP